MPLSLLLSTLARSILLASLFCQLPVAFASDAARRPNIVVLMADDLGYGELGCQGNPQIPTPHIDSIAKQGVRFTSGYVTAAYCSASRAGFITGRYQTRFGYEFNPIGHHNEDPAVGLPASEVTLAEHLHAAGYATGLIGKWHLGGHAKYHPHRHGFDVFYGFTHEGHYFVPPPYKGVTTMLRRRALPTGEKGRWVSRDGRTILSTHMGHDEPDYDANNPIVRGSQPINEQSYLTDALTREAVSFIEHHKDRPFFLFLAYNAVHSPLQGADAYMAKFKHIEDVHRRIFAAMLANLDDGVGAVLKKLRDEKLEENTLVFFLSDNGGPTRELTSSNKPLRGGKGQLHEGGIRVPFLLQWKGKLKPAVVEPRPIISLDIYATASGVAKAPIPSRRKIDGVNLLPYLHHVGDSGPGNSALPHKALFWRSQKKTALRVGNHKLIRNPGRGQSADWQLFDLAKDVGESKDLAKAMPDKLAELKAVWQGMNDQMREPFWSPKR